MAFRFYNSYQKEVVDFVPLKPGEARIYSCGPTVYDFAHIGNFRSYVFTDVLRRALKLGGYKVRHAMNITDVDDKTIRRTLEKNPDPTIADLKDYTNQYTSAFFDDIKSIGIDTFEHYPRATDYMDAMVDLVENLEKKGLAYRLENSVYFPISKFSEYGKLSGVDLSTVKAGVRYNADEYTKEDVRDFVLWKAEKTNEKIAWDTRLGRGRPGWHLECSAMIHSIFQGPIDIHTGGVDLLFPHHENEIAQSVNAYEHGFVKYWMHCEHLLVDGRKMSKSEGNFYTLRDLMEKGYHPLTVRYFLMSSHYRAKINFTLDVLDQTAQTLRRINTFYRRLEDICDDETLPDDALFADQLNSWEREFMMNLEDDLNTPRALAVLHNAMKATNAWLDERGSGAPAETLEKIRGLFAGFNSVFNIIAPELASADVDEIPSGISELLTRRNEARKEKNYALSDSLRDQISAAGYVIVDTPAGSHLKKK